MVMRIGLLCCLFMMGCGPVGPHLQESKKGEKKLQVLSTTAMIGDIVREVGGEHIESSVLITGELDPHSYEIVMGDREKFAMADVVFANGLLLEHSASMEYQLNTHEGVVKIGDALFQKHPEDFIIVDEYTVDPHIWMDVSLWARTVPLIVDQLIRFDPEHAVDYHSQGERVIERLCAMDRNMQDTLQQLPEEKQYLVTSHDAFQYYVRRYFSEGHCQKRVNAIQGLAADEQISPLDIADIVQFLQVHKVTRVFFESNLNPEGLHKVITTCKRHGMEVQLATEPLLGDTLGNMSSYFAMMQHNTRVIYENLQ